MIKQTPWLELGPIEYTAHGPVFMYEGRPALCGKTLKDLVKFLPDTAKRIRATVSDTVVPTFDSIEFYMPYPSASLLWRPPGVDMFGRGLFPLAQSWILENELVPRCCTWTTVWFELEVMT